MRSLVAWLALLLAMPAIARAQAAATFQDVPLLVNLDDQLAVSDRSGTTITGVLTRLTRGELTIRTAGGERTLPASAVREVGVIRHPRRRNVLVGAAAGAMLGVMAACTGSDRGECADGPIITGALGAAAGLALGQLVRRTTPVYRAPDSLDVPVVRVVPAVFDALALRVDLGDRLRVETSGSVKTTGRLTHLTGEEIVLATRAGDVRFTADAVRAVAVRRYALGTGALIGAGTFGLLALASSGCRSNPDCQPLAAAAVGAGAGLAVGAMIPQMKTVFRAAGARTAISPELSRGRVAMYAVRRW